jgi:D-lactate dehydrogenase
MFFRGKVSKRNSIIEDKNKIKVAFFSAETYDVDSFNRYNNSGEFSIDYYEERLTEKTVHLTKGYDAICIFTNDVVNGVVVDKLVEYGVKFIALRCAGYNNVDLKALKGRIQVANVPAYSPNAVAEHAMALLLTSIRRIHKAYNRTRNFNFDLDDLIGFELHGKTIGVIGAGKIGREFIKTCRGFGMEVIAYDKFPSEKGNITFVDKDELFRRSDIISIHCPLTPHTKHIINKSSIAKMKKGVVIINTSRGGLIDSDALLEGLLTRKIGAACLDVYEDEEEIFSKDLSSHIMSDDVLTRLIALPNVIVTAHQAFLTEEALQSIAETTLKNIDQFFTKGKSDNELQ